MRQAVAYTRVSTKDQDYGVGAQQAAIARFCEAEGFEIIESFTEKQTGKGSDAEARRPQLAAALKRAKKAKCPIIVAKLDRLSRNVHYISGLMEHKVAFIVSQFGVIDDPFMLHIYASVAEKERNLISQRTKEGLAQAKAEGVQLGHPRIHELAGKGAVTMKVEADKFAARVLPIIEGIQARGISTHRGIAAELQRLQVRTARGGTSWGQGQVANILKRRAADQA
jgi:DNA invertase Pin-like site-specific DNA recombinase